MAIILLDNLSLPDTLSLFLAQRSKALRDILHSPEGSQSAQHPRLRRDSKASIRSLNKGRDEIGAVLAEAVKAVLDTVALARAVFDKRRGVESLIDEMQRLVQVGETVETPKVVGTINTRRTSHERRASRLASISIAVPKIAFSATGPPISSGQVLQNLPSAQILLRHLPTSITGFTPFIAPSTAPELDDKLSSWQASAIGLLREAVPGWLAAVHSVADVWKLRADLNALLADGELENDVKETLEQAWNGRVEQVWDERLKEAVELVETKTRAAGEEVRAKGAETGESDRDVPHGTAELTCRCPPRIVHLHGSALPACTRTCPYCVVHTLQRLPRESAEALGTAHASARLRSSRAGTVRQGATGGHQWSSKVVIRVICATDPGVFGTDGHSAAKSGGQYGPESR